MIIIQNDDNFMICFHYIFVVVVVVVDVVKNSNIQKKSNKSFSEPINW